jgi:hypothetical protein
MKRPDGCLKVRDNINAKCKDCCILDDCDHEDGLYAIRSQQEERRIYEADLMRENRKCGGHIPKSSHWNSSGQYY